MPFDKEKSKETEHSAAIETSIADNNVDDGEIREDKKPENMQTAKDKIKQKAGSWKLYRYIRIIKSC